MTDKVKYQKSYLKAHIVMDMMKTDTKQNSQVVLWSIPMILMLIIGLVAQLTDISWVKVLSIGYDIVLALVFVGLAYYITVAMDPYAKLQKYDKDSSKSLFDKRVTYLLRLYEQAKDFDMSKIRTFIEPSEYARLAASNEYDEYYLIDFDVYAKMKSFRIEADKQIAEISATLNEVCMNEHKKIKKKKRKISFKLYRHKVTKTSILDNVEMLACECCGANVNLTVEGSCQSCGTAYDLSKYDWMI